MYLNPYLKIKKLCKTQTVKVSAYFIMLRDNGEIAFTFFILILRMTEIIFILFH